MEIEISIIEKIKELKERRGRLIEKLTDLSNYQYNKIPFGFTNNIIWNLGHTLVTPMHHLYQGSERLSQYLNEHYYRKYLKDTIPNTETGTDEINQILNLMIPAIERIESDYHAGVFIEERSLGVNGFKRAFDFLIFHEYVHTAKILDILQIVARAEARP